MVVRNINCCITLISDTQANFVQIFDKVWRSFTTFALRNLNNVLGREGQHVQQGLRCHSARSRGCWQQLGERYLLDTRRSLSNLRILHTYLQKGQEVPVVVV